MITLFLLLTLITPSHCLLTRPLLIAHIYSASEAFLLKERCDRGMDRWFTVSLLEACKIQNTKRTHKKIIERGGCPGEIDGALRLSLTPLPLTQTGVNIEQASIQTLLKIL